MHIRLNPAVRHRSDWVARLVESGWPVGLVVAVFMVMDRGVRRVADLGADGYRQPILMIELVRQQPAVAVGATLLTATAAVSRRSFGPHWPSFELGWSLRLPVGAIIVMLTWTYACYDYNLWADQLHLADRAALIVIAGLAIWRPIFTPLWSVMVTMIAFQFRYPIGVDQLAETLQLVRVTELFAALLIIGLLSGRWYRAEFVFVTIALVASAYWVSGVGKLRLGWFGVGPQLDSLFVATYGNGWLGFMSTDSAAAWGRGMGPLLWPMLIATAIVEFGALAILWGRRPLRFWLASFAVFHVGVFALTGIFFWKWIAFELVLLLFLQRERLIDHLPIFGGPHAVLGTALILAGPLWARPINLSWLDSPVNYVYRFDATMADGTHDSLPPSFFRPHDYLFTLSPFGYLSKEPELPVVWGALRDRKIFDALHAAETPDAVLAVESSLGGIHYDAERAAAFDAFIEEFVTSWNRRQSRSSGVSAVGPPPQLWTSGDGPNAGVIEHITVWKVTTYWDGSAYHEIERVSVREIEIGPTTGTS